MMIHEIAVAGGGPAAAVAAIRLAELGHDVVLLAAPWHPEPRVGEALTPGVAEQLRFLGLSEVLETAALQPTTEVELKWRSEPFERRELPAPGLLVDRNRFDAGLVAAAARRGVRVSPTRVIAATRTATGWRLACGSDGPQIVARYLIDGTGRRGPWSRRRRHYRLLAMYARLAGPGLPRCVRIAAAPTLWAWGAPGADGRYIAMVFVDPRHAAGSKTPLAARFREAVRRSGLLTDVGATNPVSPIAVCDASPDLSETVIGDDCLKVGDAALTVDPISSAGVQLAIQTAIAGAIAAHTIRSDASSTPTVASFWSAETARRSIRHRRWAAAFYREAASRFATPFWITRSDAGDAGRPDAEPDRRRPSPGPDQRLRLAPMVGIDDTPCVVGDRIERRPTITHPSLSEPVAFLGGADLPRLIGRVTAGVTTRELLHRWSDDLAPSRAAAALDWSWQRRLLEPLG